MTTYASTQARPRALRQGSYPLLSVDQVRRLHPDVECQAWQAIVELVDLGVVEARVDRAGIVRLYATEASA